MTRNGKILTAIAVIVVVVLIGGAVYATTNGSSSKKKPLIILANVDRRDLQDSATITGTLAREEQRKVTSVTQGRVSAVNVDDGTNVPPRAPLLALDGRASIAEQGTVHFFRSLTVGDRGEDVFQLEKILAAQGDNPGPIDTLFTEQTRFALAQWQAANGYPGAAPVTPQSVTVSLTGAAGTGGSYKVGPRSSVGVVIGAGGKSVTPAAARFADVQPAAVPAVSIRSTASVVTEGAPATFVVQATAAAGTAYDVNLSASGAGASEVVAPTVVTMPTGASSVQVVVPTRADNTVEPNKSFTLAVTSGSGYSLTSPTSASTTIVDANVPTLHLSGGATVSAGQATTITVTADQAPVQNTQVALTFTGDAQPGKDYQSVNPTVTLAAGHTSASMTVQTLATDTIQGERHIVASLSQSALYKAGSPSASVITIQADTSLPVVTLVSGTTYLVKGQPYMVTVGLSRPTSEALPINLAFGGNAAPGTDYAPPAGQLTVPAGQTSVQVTIATVADNTVETDRVLTVAVGASARYAVGSPSSAAVTITSQVVPELNLLGGAASLAAGSVATFTIVANQAPVKDTSINYQVVGSAQPGKDFEPIPGTVLLPAGARSVTVTIRSIATDIVFQPTDMIVGAWPIRVGQVFVKEGDAAPPGTPLLSLTDPNFTVTLKASATDRTKLAVGQKCDVKLTGGDKEVTGTISELDPNVTVDDKTKEESYEGKIDVADLGAADGASVTIDCVVKERKNAITVPIAAVKQNGAGHDVVRVIDLAHGSKVSEVEVKTGLTDASYIEVQSGLKGTETVIVEVDQPK